jgi:hypothetical protein
MTQDDPPSVGPDEVQSAQADPPMGTLVIRTWDEPGQTPSFRARLTYSQAPDDDPSSLCTADPAEVLSVVRQWLSARSAPSPGV